MSEIEDVVVGSVGGELQVEQVAQETDSKRVIGVAREMYSLALADIEACKPQIDKKCQSSLQDEESLKNTLQTEISDQENESDEITFLVALLERYPGLSEAQKLSSLARNRYAAAQRAKHDAEQLSAQGEMLDESIEDLGSVEAIYMQQYQILVAAISALKMEKEE